MTNSGIKDGTASWRVRVYRGVCSFPVVVAALTAFIAGLVRTTFLPYIASDWYTEVDQAFIYFLSLF